MAGWDYVGRAVRDLAAGLKPAAPPSRMRAMLTARRAMIDNVVGPGSLVDVRTRSPRMAQAMADESLVFPPLTNGAVALLSASDQAERVRDGSLLGRYFIPGYETPYQGIVTYRPGDRNVRRHEVMHGYNHAASRGLEGLPFWSRVVGNAPGAIARPLDELIAQRAGGAGFMDIPWDSYARIYASDGSPGAARVARVLEAAQAARRAADDPTVRQVALGVGVGTGATLGAAYAYGALYPDEEERPAPEAIAAQFDRVMGR